MLKTSVEDKVDARGDVILDIRDLATHFPMRNATVHAVDGVSLKLRRGKTTCVVGESGSGKSVTARSVLQIVDAPGRIVGGTIALRTGGGEVDIATLHPRSRAIRAIRGRDIAMIFQEPMSSLSPVHTIGNQIIESIRLHEKVTKAEARARAIELLAQVEIREPEKAIDQYTFEFSGGMRQRAMIAMALSCNPQVLIADEPTTALDVTTQAEILDLMRSLQEKHDMAIMFITHDMGVVAEIADDVVVMRHGKVVETGEVNEIFANPRHAYTRRLLESVVKLEQRAEIKRPEAEVLAEQTDPILSVKNVSVVFPLRGPKRKGPARGFRAVNDVSFDLRRGESLGIVGESGSGKTTLGRVLASVLSPSEGGIRFHENGGAGGDVGQLEGEALRNYRRQVRMVFQDPHGSLNPRMTVGQIVAEPLLNNGIARGDALRDRVYDLLEQVGLPAAVAERYPHAFSGGQRQRICIARAIALEPRVVICDEATSALDVSIRSQVLDLLIRLQERLDLSFVFIAHDIGVVRYFCDRVAVMRKGEIVEMGPASQVCDNPQHPYTKALISAVPHPDPTARSMHLRHRYEDAGVS
ncbi:ABC transporter ATP-binding protein [Oceaniglobus trochenteri]|uniref:ABC transporter ATP-binding protein n=1 Tax=Oceaniglobus trochenteri TaxID=2763260 RepID=UPI001D0019B1|nr:ABC transporter ATP-binding protein [Oceaniglobus trochenteri]